MPGLRLTYLKKTIFTVLAGLLAAGCKQNIYFPHDTAGYTERTAFEKKEWAPAADKASLEGFYFNKENVDSSEKYVWVESKGRIVAQRKDKDVFSFQVAGVAHPIDIYAAPEEIMGLGEALYVTVSGRVVRSSTGAAAIEVDGMEPVTRDLLPKLVNALSDTNPRMRGLAAQALGRLGAEARTSLPQLAGAVSDSSAYVRKLAVSALGNIGPEVKRAVPELTKALGDIDPYIRCGAAEILGETGAEAGSAVPGLISMLGDRDPSVRHCSIVALGRIGPGAERAIPELSRIFLLKEEQRPLLAGALGNMGAAGALALTRLNNELAARKAGVEDKARREEERRLLELKKLQNKLLAGPKRAKFARPVFLGFAAGFDIYYEGNGSFMYWEKGTRGTAGGRGSLIIHGDYDGYHNFAAFTNDLVNNKFPELKPLWAIYKKKYRIPY